MITLPGTLAIKTIHGRNGDFNVGRLLTSLCEFTVKNPELDQYKEGKYDGEFIITEICPSVYPTNGRMIFEIRAHLGGMTLSNIDALSKDEAHQLSPQEVDPIDEESTVARPAPSTPEPAVASTPDSSNPLIDTTPFGIDTTPESADNAELQEQADAELFGALWPLAQVFKLDSTVNRRVLRQQTTRLDVLGYELDYKTQQWHPKAA